MIKCRNRCKASISILTGALGLKFLLPVHFLSVCPGLFLVFITSSISLISPSCHLLPRLWNSSQIRPDNSVLTRACDVMYLMEFQMNIVEFHRCSLWCHQVVRRVSMGGSVGGGVTAPIMDAAIVCMEGVFAHLAFTANSATCVSTPR